MISLFLDTACHNIIVSLIKDNTILVYHESINDIDLSSRIMPIVDEVFKEAKLRPNDVDRIYVVTGPGSFTGTRIGVTIAKTMAWTLNKKVIPLSELELLATSNVTGNYLLPLIDARRNYVYGALFDKELNVVLQEQHVLLNDLIDQVNSYSNIVIISHDSFEEKEIIQPKVDILKIIQKHENDIGINPHILKPNYLKLTEAEENFNSKND